MLSFNLHPWNNGTQNLSQESFKEVLILDRENWSYEKTKKVSVLDRENCLLKNCVPKFESILYFKM